MAGTFDDLRPTLPVMLANLQTVGEVMRVNLPNLQQILVVYPALSSAYSNVHRGFQLDGDREKGQGPLDVKLGSSQNPAPCTEGFEDIQRRDPSDTSPMEPSTTSYCTLPSSDPRAVRGARNLPCATDPTVRTAEVSECPRGLPSTWQEMLHVPTLPPARASRLLDQQLPLRPSPSPRSVRQKRSQRDQSPMMLQFPMIRRLDGSYRRTASRTSLQMSCETQSVRRSSHGRTCG